MESDKQSDLRAKGRGELVTWYLARLRSNSRLNSLERRLTPMTLVETDRSLIQEFVMRSQGSFEQRCNELLQSIQQNQKGIKVGQAILLTVSILGSIAMVALICF
jgi:hypothetical protein